MKTILEISSETINKEEYSLRGNSDPVDTSMTNICSEISVSFFIQKDAF